MKVYQIIFSFRYKLLEWFNPEAAREIYFIVRDFTEDQDHFRYIYRGSDFYRCGNLRCCPIMWWQAPDGFLPGKRTDFPGGISIDFGSHSYRVKKFFGRHYGED